jgi:protein-S-isoprenylcysteine O-methyltransferase Ste14
MKTKIDSPGVAVPPPLVYVVTFLFSIALQALFPVDHILFNGLTSHIAAISLIAISVAFIFPALRKFIKTKNTLITIKPANSLQTTGIYSISRNPMYLGLLLLYAGLALLVGNWWTIIFIPVLVILITCFIIIPEEHYLLRKFGNSYSSYKLNVRRLL